MAHPDTQCDGCKVPLRLVSLKNDAIKCVCTSCNREYTRSVRRVLPPGGVVWGGRLAKVGFEVK